MTTVNQAVPNSIKLDSGFVKNLEKVLEMEVDAATFGLYVFVVSNLATKSEDNSLNGVRFFDNGTCDFGAMPWEDRKVARDLFRNIYNVVSSEMALHEDAEVVS